MKSRAIPMHNFLLRYFPAYRARMFPTVALRKWNMGACTYERAYVCVCMCASVPERNRASGNVEKRKNERAKENCRLNRVDDPCSAKRNAVNFFGIRVSFCQLNNVKVFFVINPFTEANSNF